MMLLKLYAAWCVLSVVVLVVHFLCWDGRDVQS